MNEPIRNVPELLEAAGTDSLAELGQTLASIVDLDEPVELGTSPGGGITMTVDGDSYDIDFPTTWDDLIEFVRQVFHLNDEDGDTDEVSDTDAFIN